MTDTLDQAIYQFQRADEETHYREVAKQYRLPYVNLVGYPVLPNTLKLLTADEVMLYGAIPFLKVGSKLRVALSDPKQETLTFLQQLADRMKLEIDIAICSPTSFRFALNLYLIENQKAGQSQEVKVTKEQQQALKSITSKEDLEEKIAQANATRLLDILFASATGMEASDIHIEPQENDIRVRFRIDGILQEITQLQAPVYKQLLSRVKYLAAMKLDVRKTAQDGRFSITLADSTLDVRVSTLPSAYGEIIDMRLLRPHAALVKMDDLGLNPQALELIKAAISLPHGMILVTGPTGSGKSTTLYAILDTVNKTGVKIITLEDPIEYRIAGVDQVQVDPEHNMAFADALKGVLRQDPDIIMVGEIRDKETADIGLQAAMTGHLFLSTLHTNNAPSALARLIDMGIEPYKIAGAINLIIGQRLVRKICTQCNGKGCPTCNNTGFRGRIPIIEVLKPSQVIDNAILNRASVRDLYSLAMQQGMISMYQDGVDKVNQGITTIEEVTRVTAEVEED